LSVPEPLCASVAVAVQTMLSLGDAQLGSNVRVSDDPTDAPSASSHSYFMEGVPPSTSDAVALHVNSVLVVIPVLGVISTLSTTGSVFSTKMNVDWMSLPPSPSDTVAWQCTSSFGLTSAGVKLRVSPVPKLAPLLSFQAYVMVRLPPSSSVAVAEQVRDVLVVTPVSGTMDTESTTGFVLMMSTLAESVASPPDESEAVTSQVTESSGDTMALVSASVLDGVPSTVPA